MWVEIEMLQYHHNQTCQFSSNSDKEALLDMPYCAKKWILFQQVHSVFIIWSAPRKKSPWRSCDIIEKWCHIFTVKKVWHVCLKMLSGLQSFWRLSKTSEPFKISKLPPDSHCTINMMLIYRITEVKICGVLTWTSRRHNCLKWCCCIYAMFMTP